MNLTDAIALYLQEQRQILDGFPADAVAAVATMVFDCHEADGTLYAMGNGGNAGTLDHACCDFTHPPFVSEDKTKPLPPTIKRLRFVSLCASPAELTGLTGLTGLVNDLGPERMYAAAPVPVVTCWDLVMAYSGSGNSPNVVRALQVAAAVGAATFATTKGDGGRCAQIADVCLIVPGASRFPGQTGANDNSFHFEDAILAVNHMLVGLLKERVAQRTAAG
jgi:D-sedoheptulose 7-phosphate isomerase